MMADAAPDLKKASRRTVEMIFNDKKLNELSILFGEEQGFQIKKDLHSCILTGNLKELKSCFQVYRSAFAPFFKEHGTVNDARNLIHFEWAQLNVHLTETVLSLREVRKIEEEYYFSLDLVDSIDALYDEYEKMAADLTATIWEKLEESHYSPVVKECCVFVKDHVYDRIKVADVAEAVHFSTSYVSHRFQEEVGMTLENYIRMLKIRESRLLLHSNMPIAAIAATLGFSSQSHFTVAFKKETDLTPKQFRAL